MYNIDIDPDQLTILIEKLKKDNEDIQLQIKKINDLVRKFDDNVWLSPEKKKIDNNFIPYIRFEENTVLDKLNRFIILLINAKNAYLESDAYLQKKAKNLSSIESVEKL